MNSPALRSLIPVPACITLSVDACPGLYAALCSHDHSGPPCAEKLAPCVQPDTAVATAPNGASIWSRQNSPHESRGRYRRDRIDPHGRPFMRLAPLALECTEEPSRLSRRSGLVDMLACESQECHRSRCGTPQVRGAGIRVRAPCFLGRRERPLACTKFGYRWPLTTAATGMVAALLPGYPHRWEESSGCGTGDVSPFS